jgi:hypothetical protein
MSFQINDTFGRQSVGRVDKGFTLRTAQYLAEQGGDRLMSITIFHRRALPSCFASR